MTRTEDVLMRALRDEATRFEPAPGAYQRNLERTARQRRRLLVMGVAASVVLTVTAVAVGPRLGQLRDRSGDDTPASDPAVTVTRIADAPIAPREAHSSAYVRGTLFVWGGTAVLSAAPVARPAGSNELPFADGAVYSPDSDTWRIVAPAPLAARQGAPAVAIGEAVLVTGGRHHDRLFRDGARYDVASDRWTRIADAPVCGQHAALVGRLVYVWGVCEGSHRFASYDPQRDAWSTLPVPPVHAVQQLFEWQGKVVAFEATGDGATYDPRLARWTDLPPVPGSEAAKPRLVTAIELAATSDGTRLLAVGGHGEKPGAIVFVNTGAGWDAVDASSAELPQSEGPALVSASRLIWSTVTGLGALSTDPPRAQNVRGRHAGVSLGRHGMPSLHEIAPGRVLIWGGRTVDNHDYDDDGVSTNTGLIVQF